MEWVEAIRVNSLIIELYFIQASCRSYQDPDASLVRIILEHADLNVFDDPVSLVGVRYCHIDQDIWTWVFGFHEVDKSKYITLRSVAEERQRIERGRDAEVHRRAERLIFIVDDDTSQHRVI